MSKITKLLKLKDYITLTGTTLGFIALVCATVGTREFLSLGFFLCTITIGTDLMDGFIARKTGTVNKIGIELDSLNDSLTFGIAPALLTFQAFKTGTIYDYVLMGGSIIFALGGILRLARFNISEEEGYTGVPTPLSGLFLINFFYANYFFAFAMGGGGDSGLTYPFPMISNILIPFFLIIFGWFNITTYITFGKKGKNVYKLFFLLAPLCPILGIIGILNPNFLLSMIIALFFSGSLLIELIYILSGFWIKYRQGREK
ncbi:MAG: Archaetidylserine synthase [Promethearchaeota archaeon]|nr:MAG: Archaetidylserine synthase [Candidatus Lokiarchaeota archaeon]